MLNKELITEQHFTISLDIINDILHVNWKGDQSKESVMDGCEKIRHYLVQHHCKKVLNDNTNVTSIWDDASDWVAVDWFPRMHSSGCEYFAWVYSPNVFSKLSTDKTLNRGIKGVIVTTFKSVENAYAWLKVM
ncbi:hypothetical protein [Pontibacter sp. H249]|uniref:hypothetical protein n=1 Tax=Pontibacter sp. H249 TaxID=3133420 RepID=UPI0030BAE575